MDGVTTKFLPINQSVPQGTVLGPILFSLMINDLKAVDPERSLLIKFAGDMNLGVPVRGDQDPSIEEVDNIRSWSTENRIKLNFSKTSEMVVRGKIPCALDDRIFGIERKDSLKLIGGQL